MKHTKYILPLFILINNQISLCTETQAKPLEASEEVCMEEIREEFDIAITLIGDLNKIIKKVDFCINSHTNILHHIQNNKPIEVPGYLNIIHTLKDYNDNLDFILYKLKEQIEFSSLKKDAFNTYVQCLPAGKHKKAGLYHLTTIQSIITTLHNCVKTLEDIKKEINIKKAKNTETEQKEAKETKEESEPKQEEKQPALNTLQKANTMISVLEERILIYFNRMTFAYYDNYFKTKKFPELKEHIDKMHSPDEHINSFLKEAYISIDLIASLAQECYELGNNDKIMKNATNRQLYIDAGNQLVCLIAQINETIIPYQKAIAVQDLLIKASYARNRKLVVDCINKFYHLISETAFDIAYDMVPDLADIRVAIVDTRQMKQFELARAQAEAQAITPEPRQVLSA